MTALAALTMEDNEISSIDALSRTSNLKWLYLSRNQLTDIRALVSNPGLGDCSWIDISENHVDISENSSSMNAIRTVQARGVRIKFAPQD